jgi:hypothetical protein
VSTSSMTAEDNVSAGMVSVSRLQLNHWRGCEWSPDHQDGVSAGAVRG